MGLLVSEKKSSLDFPIISLWELMTPGAWQIWTPGAWLVEFMYKITKHRYILNLLALGLMVSKNKIFEGSLAVQVCINIQPPRVWPVQTPGA